MASDSGFGVSGGSVHNAARRWEKKATRQGYNLADLSIRPAEARAALVSIIKQLGNRLIDVLGYDVHKSKFHVKIEDWDGQRIDYTIPGETVHQVVMAARTMCGGPSPLVRPSDLIKKA